MPASAANVKKRPRMVQPDATTTTLRLVPPASRCCTYQRLVTLGCRISIQRWLSSRRPHHTSPLRLQSSPSPSTPLRMLPLLHTTLPARPQMPSPSGHQNWPPAATGARNSEGTRLTMYQVQASPMENTFQASALYLLCRLTFVYSSCPDPGVDLLAFHNTESPASIALTPFCSLVAAVQVVLSTSVPW
jgi:hypothetical protein